MPHAPLPLHRGRQERSGTIAAVNAPEPIDLAAPWRTAAHAALGADFGTALAPQPVPEPHWVARSDALAAELRIAQWMDSSHALALLAGNATAARARPFATVYSGHQFGVWASQLGDGRALLLGELDTPPAPMEIQLKGSGLTPYSRMGDGRAVLRSSIREFLCSEAMHHLGIPTTRALAVVGSPLPVRRETIETAAVVTRVAPSFLRFGHFEHFAFQAPNRQALKTLADFAIERHFPACREAANPYLALLDDVARRTARLVAQWQAVGFCHGVMNTDNMSLLGLTIDYGPFGFLDGFDPGHICNHSDAQGRYAYGRQPSVAFWNLHVLAQALLPLLAGEAEPDEAHGEQALEAIEPFRAVHAESLSALWRAKLGLSTTQADDDALVQDLLRLMAAERTDFTIAWRALGALGAGDAQPARDLFIDRAAFDAWAARYAGRIGLEGGPSAERRARMDAANPKF
ncbi:MAG TPA: YdiU family protein, partial [Methylibium sp.]|uniref:protein adenylyltransferase SelO n=1 Tax=Methylibium sp. TaxID=2067992 RepID=UPI002DB71687